MREVVAVTLMKRLAMAKAVQNNKGHVQQRHKENQEWKKDSPAKWMDGRMEVGQNGEHGKEKAGEVTA